MDRKDFKSLHLDSLPLESPLAVTLKALFCHVSGLLIEQNDWAYIRSQVVSACVATWENLETACLNYEINARNFKFFEKVEFIEQSDKSFNLYHLSKKTKQKAETLTLTKKISQQLMY